jgi:hypothetical protein
LYSGRFLFFELYSRNIATAANNIMIIATFHLSGINRDLSFINSAADGI